MSIYLHATTARRRCLRMYARTSLTLLSYCGVHAVFVLCVALPSRACIPWGLAWFRLYLNGKDIQLNAYKTQRNRCTLFISHCFVNLPGNAVNINSHVVRFEVLTAVTVLWNVTLCSLAKVYRCFGRTYGSIFMVRMQQESRWRSYVPEKKCGQTSVFSAYWQFSQGYTVLPQ
jgi:hypothetical protein